MSRAVEPVEPYQPVVEEVVVSASYLLSRLNQQQHHLELRDLQTIPSPGGDTLRAVATLPGAATSGIAASLRFRGGDANEVLYLIDKVPVIDPFHLREFHNVFTAINPNVVDGAEIFTSGFPVEHGGKISGVVSLDLLKPVKRFEGVLDLNTVAVAAHAAGTTASMNWLVSARRSTIDSFISRLEADYGRPRFHDELLRVEWTDNNKALSFGVINTDDEIQLNDADTGERGASRFRYLTVWGDGSITVRARWFSEFQLFWLQAEGRHSGTLDNPVDAVGQLRAVTKYDVARLRNNWI